MTQIPDYTTMNGPDLLAALGTDTKLWADAFCQYTGFHDPSWALTWFANAMMAKHDALLGNPILCGDHAQYLLDKYNDSKVGGPNG